MKSKLPIITNIFLRITIKTTFVIALFLFVIHTRLFGNIWLLLTDSSNYIPDTSNILTFTPTKIDSGSGGYWRYGEDLSSYYYFTLSEKIYITAPKNQVCEQLDPLHYATWCEMTQITDIE